MKKLIKFHKILLFFCCFIAIFAFFSIDFFNLAFKKSEPLANAEHFYGLTKKDLIDDYEYNISLEGRNFKFDKNSFSQVELSERQKALAKNPKKSVEILSKIGLDSREIVKFLCPEAECVLEKIKEIANKRDIKPTVTVVKNKCKLEFSKAIQGRFVNEQKFYDDIFCLISKGEKNIKITAKIEMEKVADDPRKELTEKSCFSTGFASSSESRKSNIATALACFDGLVLEEGEVLSFNQATGVRNEEAGYKPAKIISNGTFIEGFGGGVCQVSTTLYNACLLAGLEILEVHSHSLPVSYIEPSFDAMVNVGSSDLVIRNNSGGKIIFTSSSENNICKIKIFGKKNKYKITRFSEKYKIIPAEPEIIETNFKKYGDYELEIGQEKRLSSAKDGFCSRGYLNFYDTSGNLVETKKIRENRYNATKGIILKNTGES